MALPDFSALTVSELLATHSTVLDELRRKEVIRSKNNPTGDYAEWLVSKSLGLTLETNSAKGFDAKDPSGVRYQIKGRRITPENSSRQLGVIRNLHGNDFDILVAVVFDKDWQVECAAKIPHHAIERLSAFRPHVNGHVMHLRASVLEDSSVENITHELQRI